jgi:glycosyltransferase involved in cell wall biosynthesis/SAM-dependent methyltransferase
MPCVLCILDMLDEAQPNACGYIRLFLPLTKKIVRDCFDVRFVTLEDLPYFTADVVVTQRTVINTLEKANRLITYCRDTGARLVFDLDDDLLFLPSHHPEHELYDEFRPVGLRLAAEADEFWASTRSLADRFVGIAQRISVMPNQLDDRIWSAHDEDDSHPRRPVRFLYMGTPTHRPDFDQLIKPALSQLKREFGESFELDLIGVANEAAPGGEWNIPRRSAEIGNSYPAFVRWLQSLGGYDVGLAPLLDVVFNRCKSDIKWLEYSAMGLATIAANLPAYNESIEHERTGLLAAADANGFREAMRRLIVDSELRRSLKRNASRLVEEKLRSAPTQEPRLERLVELARRPGRRGFQAAPPRPMAASDVLFGRIDRQTLAQAFLLGRGIEIGALQLPLPVPTGAEVRYVDRMTKTDLYEHYPELRSCDLVEVDIIDDGETLSTIQDSSQDFIIANHVIEHCQDPIGTLKNFLRVLRPGGIIYMAVPDMRHTFDRDRSRTDISHIIQDHIRGPAVSRKQHFREWATLVEPHFGRVCAGEKSIKSRVRELMTQDYSIHFHTFIPEDMCALINYCAETERMPLSVVFGGEFGEEMIFILRKTNVPNGLPFAQQADLPVGADVIRLTKLASPHNGGQTGVGAGQKNGG